MSSSNKISTLTAQIVAGYSANHKMEQSELLHLIQEVGNTLLTINGQKVDKVEVVETPTKKSLLMAGGASKPAVPFEESVTDDYIICLEDGKKLKMLKRHLKSFYNMTPDDYRRKWGLADDYPMVCRNYSKKRSALAKNSNAESVAKKG